MQRDISTIEGQYKSPTQHSVKRSTAPPRMGETSIRGYVPSNAQRLKRAEIAAQQAKPEPKPKGGRARWAQLVGISRDHLYGIRVKVTGIKAETYWLPYDQAENLFYEITGCDLSYEVSEL